MLGSDSPHVPTAPDGRLAGIILIVGSVATVVAIVHHPTIAAHGGDVLQQMLALATTDRIVHGSLIAIYCAFLFAMYMFSARRGPAGQREIGARIAYAIATGAIVVAALVDGFVLPALVEHATAAGQDTGPAFMQLLGACGALVQIATKFATAATGVAVLLWSLGLVMGRSAVRAVGVLGIVVAIGSPAVTFLSGTLNPHNLAVLVVLQAVWYIWVGSLLVQRRL